jgi:hypothetical protein
MGRVVGVDTEETSHILDHDKGWVKLVNGVGHLGPQA